MPQPAIGKYRWTIVTLLFFATSINYIDRQVIGLLKPILADKDHFNWTETDYSHIVMAFQASYAIGLLLFGRLIDKLGTKLGYALSVIVWSIAAILHGAAKTTMGFVAARIGLGFGEAGNFPAAIKTVADWFPRKERALATGIFNSGSNIGAVTAPLLVPWILSAYGWQEAFVITGALSVVWLVFWVIYYEIPARQKRLSATELAYINSDTDEALMNADKRLVPYGKLFRMRQTWAFIFGKFLTDPVWYFLLLWLPDYFSGAYHLDLKKPGWPLVIVYTATTVGSIGGGYLSSYFISRGWTVNRARKTAMFLIAVCVLPIITVKYATNMWAVVALISLAAASHQAWSANIFTVATDLFPKRAVSSVIGIGSMAGSVGGILFPILIGYVLDTAAAAGNKTAGYNFIFIICGVAYLLAWCALQLLVPKMQRVELVEVA